MKTGTFKIPNSTPYGTSSEGYFVLENAKGEAVRTFKWEGSGLIVIYRHDTRRVETVSSLKALEDAGVEFDILTQTTQTKIKKSAVEIGERGRIKWVPQIAAFSREYDLAPDHTLEPKKAFGWSAGLQVGLALLFAIAGFLSGSGKSAPKEVTVTMLSQDTVQKLLEEQQPKERRQELESQKALQAAPAPKMNPRDIVVAPSERKIKKNTPVPTKSTSFKRTAVAHSKGVHGGGYKSDAPRGYGTNEPHMNSIGALGALNSPRVKGGNGGRGGLNLQAVGTEPGSGAGGKGYGGFGSNGGGGKGLGGLGTGKGMGLANSMYGKGLIAAPFGDGSPAPGSGGYGTRGKMGGGAQGAGYGTTTVVGSWKGTGPKGDGPAGSGVGNGDPNGSPFGVIDGDDSDAIVTGGLDKDQINEVIMRHLGQIRYCYEQGLQKQPGLSGRVAVKFQIAGSGRVSLAGVKHSSVRSAQIEGCIVSKVKTWNFPKPQGGVNVAVTYPFVLTRGVSMR